jgi:hypothetical protein
MERKELQAKLRELSEQGYNVVRIGSPTPVLEWCYSLYLEGTLELVSEVYE